MLFFFIFPGPNNSMCCFSCFWRLLFKYVVFPDCFQPNLLMSISSVVRIPNCTPQFQPAHPYTNLHIPIPTCTPQFKPAHPNSNPDTPIPTCTPQFQPAHPNSNLQTPIPACTPQIQPAHPNSNLHTPIPTCTPQLLVTAFILLLQYY